MENLTIFKFIDDSGIRYFDSLELATHVLYSALDKILDDDPNVLIHVTSSCHLDKPLLFEIHRLDLSILSYSDL